MRFIPDFVSGVRNEEREASLGRHSEGGERDDSEELGVVRGRGG